MSITSRLILIAIVPPFLVSLIVTFALYLSGKNEVIETVQERGRLVATTLAETSQYGVVSGNAAYLEKNIEQLQKTDASIARIEVLNATRQLLAETGIAAKPNPLFVFERAIRNVAPDIDMFAGTTGPHVSDANPTLFKEQAPAGFVVVTMSQDPIIAEKKRRLLLGIFIVLVATVFGGVTGLWLAQRLRSPLREVITRTQELQLAIDAAAQADAEKRRLITRGNALVEEERQRISVEIHDHLGGSLIVMNMKANHIAALAAGPVTPQRASEIEKCANAISETTQGLYSKARDLVKSLRPEVIDTLGLKRAIAEMVRNYDEVHPACAFTFYSSEGFPNLRGPKAITAYRLVQEALTNIVKHSNASKASVKLDRIEFLQIMIITVTDNGRGFDTKARHVNSVGLIGMRERVSATGGSMTLDSKPGRGTTINFRLPLPDQPTFRDTVP